METQKIIDSVNEGDTLHIDAFIDLRIRRQQLENELALIKSFEDDNLERIAATASEYPKNVYRGFEIKSISGRQTFSFKNIAEWNDAEAEKKKIEDKYRSAFLANQKGLLQVVDGQWADENQELHDFPEMSVSKGYLTIKQK